MKKSFEALNLRRRSLLEQSTMQRDEVSQGGHNFMSSLSTLDVAFNVIQRARQNPKIVAGLAIGLFLLKPKGIKKLIMVSAFALKAARIIVPLLRRR